MRFYITMLIYVAGTFMVAQDQISPKLYSNDWEDVKMKGLNLIRLEVPGGWFVREGLGKKAFLGEAQTRMMLFVPDPQHEWAVNPEEGWETLKLVGLNLLRIRVPQGWLVREGWGKIGSENQTNMILYLEDVDYTWNVKPKDK